MPVFKVMTGEFGIDGLISSHSIHSAENSDDAFKFIIDRAENGHIFERNDAPTYWVEEHESADKHSPIYTDIPYPQVKKPDYPEWFISKMRSITFPTTGEVLEAILNIGKKTSETGIGA